MFNPPILEDNKQFGKLNIKTLSMGQHSKQIASDSSQYICILPFVRTQDNRIKSIYALETINPIDGTKEICSIIDEFNPDLDKTLFDSLNRSMVEEIGIDLESSGVSVNDIHLLGEFSQRFPVEANFVCYGVDLTGKNSIEFTRALSKDKFSESSIVNIEFYKVVNGDIKDSNIITSCFLLISNFN
jgi:hypothetical protein